MSNGQTESRQLPSTFLRLILIFVLLISVAWAQGAATSDPQTPAGAGTATQQPPEEQEQKISPQEAEKLFRSVDEILGFASKDTSFPIKHEVKRRLVSRDEVASYVQKHV